MILSKYDSLYLQKSQKQPPFLLAKQKKGKDSPSI